MDDGYTWVSRDFGTTISFPRMTKDLDKKIILNNVGVVKNDEGLQIIIYTFIGFTMIVQVPDKTKAPYATWQCK